MIARLDRAWYLVERAVVVGALSAMSVVVFVDVAHRMLVDAGPDAGTAVAVALTLALSWFAARSAGARRPAAVGAAAAAALVGFALLVKLAPSRVPYAAAALGAAVALWRSGRRAAAGAALAIAAALAAIVPEGFSWAKEVSLILLLWVGFLGASMATHDRRHIQVDFARKLVPERWRSGYECASNLVVAGFTGLLAVLAFRYVFGEDIGLYRLGGRFDHTGIPGWVGIAAVPLGFAVMTLRFAGHAVAAARGRLLTAQGTH